MNCPIPSLAKYKFVLGIPNKGFHKKRIGPYALNDMLGTIFIAIILTFVFKPLKYINKQNILYNNYIYNLIINFLILFIIGEILHYLFCLDTAFIKQIKNIFK
jgi:hypothetical protein